MHCIAFPFRFWSTLSSSSQCLCFSWHSERISTLLILCFSIYWLQCYSTASLILANCAMPFLRFSQHFQLYSAILFRRLANRFFASPCSSFAVRRDAYAAFPFLRFFQFSSITSLIFADNTSAASSSRAYSGGCVSPISHPSTVLLPIR